MGLPALSPPLQQSRFDGAIILHQMHHLSDAEIDSCFVYVSQKAPAGFLK